LYIFLEPEINSISFLLTNGERFVYKTPKCEYDPSVKNSSWYKECVKNKNKVFSINNFKVSENSHDNQVDFLVGVSPNFNSFNKSTEFIYFEIKTQVLDSIYSKFTNDKVGKMIIADSDGKVIISPDKNLLGKNIADIEYLNRKYKGSYTSYRYQSKGESKYISKYKSEKTDWSIINIVDYRELTKDTSNIMKTLLVIFVIFIILFIAYSKSFFRDIVLPIKQLINKMKGIKYEKFDETINVDSNLDEIVELESNYNTMLNDIKNLIEERDLKERERSKEEIKVLQAQINPHFIYNTLNVIKLMATISKVDNIKNVTDSFMKLLSATFKSEATLIKVEEELQYLDNYIEIMKVRFGDDFNIITNVDDDVKELYVIKLILQPIVENAIIHGISQIDGDKNIIVSGYLENEKLIFEVEDNGVGMTDDEIKNIFNCEERSRRGFNSIGLKNVDRRIKLNCGEEYGIVISSEKNKFTKVKLILPIIKEQVNY
jgi:two-component system sensor histidine kinase YesM